MRRALLSPQSLALCALVALTAASRRAHVASRCRVASRRPEPIPAAARVTPTRLPATFAFRRTGAYALTVFSAGRCAPLRRRRAGGHVHAGGQPATQGADRRRRAPRARAVHTGRAPPTRPAELVWSGGRQPKAIPPEALSPRSMAPARVARPRLSDAADDRPGVAVVRHGRLAGRATLLRMVPAPAV